MLKVEIQNRRRSDRRRRDRRLERPCYGGCREAGRPHERNSAIKLGGVISRERLARSRL